MDLCSVSIFASTQCNALPTFILSFRMDGQEHLSEQLAPKLRRSNLQYTGVFTVLTKWGPFVVILLTPGAVPCLGRLRPCKAHCLVLGVVQHLDVTKNNLGKNRKNSSNDLTEN